LLGLDKGFEVFFTQYYSKLLLLPCNTVMRKLAGL